MNVFFKPVLLITLCCGLEVSAQQCDEMDFSRKISVVEPQSIFQDPAYYTWGASPIKGEDGKYHIFYSRWEKKWGFLAWLTHSEVAHAVSDHATGPYKFSDLTLPARGAEFWDGLNTHNPTIHFFEGKYYLYYTGNTGDGVTNMTGYNFSHRNNQRLGVAFSSSPYGPWERLDRPVIDVSAQADAHDALMMANPSITRMPDGKYLMIYKAVAKKKPLPYGGPVVHLCAIADSPVGPFRKVDKPIFTDGVSAFPAEDPYIWYQDGAYYAIVKDMKGTFTGAGQSLALFCSRDGLDWKPAKNPLVSTLQITTSDGKVHKLKHLERPQLLLEGGKPTALFLAADSMSNYTVVGHTFNVAIKLKE